MSDISPYGFNDEFVFWTFLRGVKSDPQTKLCSHQWGIVINQWGVKAPTLPTNRTLVLTINEKTEKGWASVKN